MKSIINYLLIIILFLLITYTYNVEQLENKLNKLEDELSDQKHIKVFNNDLYLDFNFPNLTVSNNKKKWNIIKEGKKVMFKITNNSLSKYYLEHFNNKLQLSIYKNGPSKIFELEKHNNNFYIKVPNTNKYFFVNKNKVELSNNKTLFQN